VSLPNGIFRPTVLAGCTSVIDGQTDHATVTPLVAIGRIAIATPPNNGHNSRNIEDTYNGNAK